MQNETSLQNGAVQSLSVRLIAAGGAALMAAGAGVVAYFDPAKASFLPACPILSVTGFACPGCGLTRGFHSLFHGDIIPALDFNLLVPFWALIFGWMLVSLVVLAVRGRGLSMWPVKPAALVIIFLVLVLFGVLRNIPSWPFTILFP